jgi:hypothetical protein
MILFGVVDASPSPGGTSTKRLRMNTLGGVKP